jgi:hypothetical protein
MNLSGVHRIQGWEGEGWEINTAGTFEQKQYSYTMAL